METLNKTNSVGVMDGVENKVANQRGMRTTDLLLRVFAMVLTLAAAIVLGVDKQTKIVPIRLVESLPPINIPVVARWHYLSAFVYFVASNGIACSYAALSLLLLSIRGKKRSLVPIIITLDLLMVALLFSSNGAATAIGLMGYKGNSHVRWNKVCNVFGKFCDQVGAAIALSLLGSTVFLLLVVLAAFGLHKKSK